MIETYFQAIETMLQKVLAAEAERMKLAAAKVADCIADGGVVHLFGCGHSHILTEEVFYRAGGLVPVRPIFYEPLMLHEGAVRSSELERRNGLAGLFMDEQDIRKGEVMFVLSTSGRNPVPVDVALAAKAKGAYTIGITSIEYSHSQPSRHASGQRLSDAVDLAIDNKAVKGDAVLTHERVKVPFTPTSTVVGAAILNAVLAQAVALLAERGVEPPVFLSGNIDGADAHNEELIAKYKGRIPLLS
ncbi:SIS domain-containing protein [Paenibacillus mesophilus]|uniref:SIS domain-containing protein n=1 Tax=Paenibacillus mesophilus TaxID=2582849 RepID=UPI00110E9BED|nr:SIS domain-containing protein [Paenibacillus mesophilus]TMV49511.1 SIS domain-containing protein [Paenibacillus mesophilus]